MEEKKEKNKKKFAKLDNWQANAFNPMTFLRRERYLSNDKANT